MLDISPEKLTMLLVVGLVVLGPNKLPAAARSLAHGLARARRLAATLTEPITTTIADPLRTSVQEPLQATLAEPRQALQGAVAELRSTIANHPIPEATSAPRPFPSPVDPALN